MYNLAVQILLHSKLHHVVVSYSWSVAMPFEAAILSQSKLSSQSTLLCLILGRGSYCTFSNFAPCIGFFNDPHHFSRCGNHHYQHNFQCHIHPIIHESTLHQALHNSYQVNSSTTSSFHLVPSGGIITLLPPSVLL